MREGDACRGARCVRTPGQAHQALPLEGERLRLPLERLRLAFQLQPLAIADLFEEANDALGVRVGHGVPGKAAARKAARRTVGASFASAPLRACRPHPGRFYPFKPRRHRAAAPG
jgi:hypothetical protein